MKDTQRIVKIDPTRLVSELTVGELLDIVEVAGEKFIYAARVCVNLDGYSPGAVSSLKFPEGVKRSRV